MSLDHIISIPDTRLSEMDDATLVMRQLAALKEDKDWRELHTRFEISRWLYERRTSDQNSTSSTRGIPTRNLIRRAVDDRHALALTNIPKTKLKATLDIDQTETFVQRFVAVSAGQQAEITLNAHVENIITDNRFDDLRTSALKHSAIYGVGYIKVDIDQTADTRYSAQLRALMRKPLWEWTEKDANAYAFLSNRIGIEHVNAPDVYWQHGIRAVDKSMMRVSIVERAEVNMLRRLYDNPEIRTGQFPWDLDEDPHNDGTIAAVLTTWELEPVTVIKSLETTEGEMLGEVEANEWVMVKTVIAGGQLVEKVITANFEDEENGIEEGSIQLPIIPYYLQKSEEHPYGYSIPEQMEVSEEFINRMYLIMYKTARKAASNGGLIINASLLGEGDFEKIQTMLDQGGAAAIRGSQRQSQNPDLSKVVVPVNPHNAQLPVSVVEAVRNEEAAFREASGTVNLAAISRARSGSGKRAEVVAADRPKTAQVGYMATSEELVWEAVYNLVQIYHRDHVNVPVDIPGEGRKMVPLNMEVSRIVPVLDDTGAPVFNEAFANEEVAGPFFNPMGVAMQEVSFIINDVTLNMKAISDGRSELPHDPVQRLQIVSAMHQLAPLEIETLQELLLPRDIRAINEAHKQKRMERERQMQEQLLGLGQMPTGDVLPGQSPNGSSAATFPQLEGADSLTPLIQDVQADQEQGQRELAGDQQRFGIPNA